MAPGRQTHWIFVVIPLIGMHIGCRQPEPRNATPGPFLGNTANETALHPSESVHLTPEQRADIQTSVALTLEKKGKTEEAIEAYSQIIEAHDSAVALHRLAVLSDQKGEFERSIQYYERALALDPNNADILCDIGYSFYLQRRWAESEDMLRKAISLTPKLPRAHNNLGLLLARSGRNDEALHQFRTAGCTESESRVNLAFVLLTNEEIEEARKQVELALDVDDSSEPARQLLAAMNRRQPNNVTSTKLVRDSQFGLASAKLPNPPVEENPDSTETIHSPIGRNDSASVRLGPTQSKPATDDVKHRESSIVGNPSGALARKLSREEFYQIYLNSSDSHAQVR
jgi:Tfp pilus assembly protein PilF